MSFKSILNPSASVTAGVAAVAVVYGIYNMNLGSTVVAAASDANHPLLESSRKKAGYTSLAFVAGLVLITKDANIGILGGFTIAAMELAYRHSIMSDATGKMQSPTGNAYTPAESAVPFAYQGEPG